MTVNGVAPPPAARRRRGALHSGRPGQDQQNIEPHTLTLGSEVLFMTDFWGLHSFPSPDGQGNLVEKATNTLKEAANKNSKGKGKGKGAGGGPQ